MVLPGAASSLRSAWRLIGIAALLVLLAAAFASAPAQAHHTTPDGPTQTPPPWDQGSDTSAEPDDDGGDADDDGDDDADDSDVWSEPAEPADGVSTPVDDLLDTGVDVLGDRAEPDWEAPQVDELPRVTSTFVSGTVARMRTDGKAAIPRGAPKRVRTLISQINGIVGKRYKWGGGHAKLVDKGYDCSGAVSYGLIRTGLLRSSLVSGSFARWGQAGAGRWVTIYANKGHVYMEVAGLRLDTSAVGDDRTRKGVRWRPAIGKRNGFKVRHPLGL